MKRIIAFSLAVIILITGCSQSYTQTQSEKTNTNKSTAIIEESQTVVTDSSQYAEESEPESKSGNRDISEIPIAPGEDADLTPFTYEANFAALDSDGLQRYVKDEVYTNILAQIDTEKYFVEDVSTVYISQEYIDELAYNSQANIFFGYTLEELDSQFEGTRYVFTLGDQGDTVVTKFEAYDDTYDKVIRNVAIGTGVILVCVTVSVVTAGAGAPAMSMIFACAAKSGTVMALSSGTIGAASSGIVTGIQTGDMDAALKSAALSGSEGFMWGAIGGSVAGGASEAIALHGATLNGLTMNEAAMIQRESEYPLDVIRQFHTNKEYEVFKTANLKPELVNGQTALIRTDIDLNLIDDLGRTNLERMRVGLSPLDSKGLSYELHHIGQNADATLAILTKAEHDNPVLHGFKLVSEINRPEFATVRKQFWKQMANILAGGI